MPIGKTSIERAAKAAKSAEEKKPEVKAEVSVSAPAEGKKPAKEQKQPARRGRKPGSKNKPKVTASVIPNPAPEVIEKVAKPKKQKSFRKNFFSIGDDLPEYLL